MKSYLEQSPTVSTNVRYSVIANSRDQNGREYVRHLPTKEVCSIVRSSHHGGHSCTLLPCFTLQENPRNMNKRKKKKKHRFNHLKKNLIQVSL